MSEKVREDKTVQVSTVSLNLPPDVKKAGLLRKLKTMKKKYFVLRMDSETSPARLEYYDNEKKFRSGIAPKRSIIMKKCFNINRKVDAKQKYAIALYTKDDCFSVVADNEAVLNEWLKAMLELQLDENCLNKNMTLKPKFEHVWQVSVGEKSLACSRNMKGLYRLCLTAKSLSLVKMEESDDPETLEFPLMSIRRCGHSNNYFLIELGRSSVTGAGELWLETEDVFIAQNMHEATLNAMKSSREHDDMGPHRPRSSSNSETSRPIATRRPVAVVSAQPNLHASVRDRCDSMPSRPRTISEGQGSSNSRSYYVPSSHPGESLRPHGLYSRNISCSPPSMPNPLSPSSMACSTDSAGSSLSIDEYDGVQSDFGHSRFSHSMPTDNAILTEPPIKEEQDDYLSMSMSGGMPVANSGGSEDSSSYLNMAPTYSMSAPTEPLYLSLNNPEKKRLNSVSSSQGLEYMEMASPLSPPEDYIPMSPVGTSTEVLSSSRTESVHSSTTSLPTSTMPDGYVYMAPAPCTTSVQQNNNNGYLDMAPLSSSLPKTSSVLSASVDIFNLKNERSFSTMTDSSEQYQLEKVKSLLTQTEDSSEDYIRPVRAYSMGSRPQPKKTHLSICAAEGSRIRAYSVGSQAGRSLNKVVNCAERDLGSLKMIDPRSGSKSSSAPMLLNRPPRLPSSASRNDLGEDLMEIDYDKPRQTSSSISGSLHDSEFTIEPVGRSRSGSCSSSSAIMSFLDKADQRGGKQDKVLHPSGQSSTSLNSSDMASDYMSMSPSADASILSSGDYVSLNPSVKYSPASSTSNVNLVKPMPNTNYHSSIKPDQISSYLSGSKPIGADKVTATQLPKGYVKRATESVPLPANKMTSSPNVKTSSEVSDYMTMSYSPSEASNVPTSNAISNAACHANSLSWQVTAALENSPELRFRKNQKLRHGNITTVSSGSTNYIWEKVVPKTPPPSPQSGAFVRDTSGADRTLIANLTRNLRASTQSTTHSEPNSRPSSACEELWLNYASLDLPPPTEDDTTSIMPVHRARAIADAEAKEPLTYAQIDFTKSKPVNLTTDTLSHL